MKRPRQHVMETEAQQLIEKLLPSEWIIRQIPKDYGVDYEIELVDQTIVSGRRIWIQLKAMQNCPIREKLYRVDESSKKTFDIRTACLAIQYIGFSVNVKTLLYSLSCPFPLLLFLADLKEHEVYWLPLQNEVTAHLSKRTPNWSLQKSATVQIPIWNRLSLEQEKNFRGLRWFALELPRMHASVQLSSLYHDFQLKHRLSDYSIGPGRIDLCEAELRSSLQAAKHCIRTALKLDVLFGDSGSDYLQPVAATFLGRGLESADIALDLLDKKDYTLDTLAMPLGWVGFAIDWLMTAATWYPSCREKFLLTEIDAFYFAKDHLHQAE